LASKLFSPYGELLSSRQQASGYSAGFFIKPFEAVGQKDVKTRLPG
jgi:hypothetical protein